jgi:hypothetical protein
MSEGVAYGAPAPAPSRSQPAYGEGQLSYEPPLELEEHLDRSSHATLAVAIFAPVIATYGAAAYGFYLAAHAIF